MSRNCGTLTLARCLLHSFINSVARAVPPLVARNSSLSALPSATNALTLDGSISPVKPSLANIASIWLSLRPAASAAVTSASATR